MKDHFLKKYKNVFRTHLKKEDVIKCPPVVIETIKDSKITPTNCHVPTPVPIHLRKAANEELHNLISAGVLEKCNHHTPWLSRGMFIAKK